MKWQYDNADEQARDTGRRNPESEMTDASRLVWDPFYGMIFNLAKLNESQSPSPSQGGGGGLPLGLSDSAPATIPSAPAVPAAAATSGPGALGGLGSAAAAGGAAAKNSWLAPLLLAGAQIGSSALGGALSGDPFQKRKSFEGTGQFSDPTSLLQEYNRAINRLGSALSERAEKGVKLRSAYVPHVEGLPDDPALSDPSLLASEEKNLYDPFQSLWKNEGQPKQAVKRRNPSR